LCASKGLKMKRNADFYDSLEELNQHLQRDKHFRLRICDRLRPITIIAPHGGFIEAGTSDIAEAIAGSEHNLFDFQGLRRQQAWQLHITSVKFRHPHLVDMLSRSQMSVSVHSMGTQGGGKILIGGLNGKFKERIYRELAQAGFPVTTKARRYRGVHPQNIVNLAQNQGVQIELTSDVIKMMFAPATPLFAPDKSPLVQTEYFDRFVAAVRRAISGTVE
jgi:phage replication-related protein YjqB (UPF0714/DUF867 family)